MDIILLNFHSEYKTRQTLVIGFAALFIAFYYSTLPQNVHAFAYSVVAFIYILDVYLFKRIIERIAENDEVSRFCKANMEEVLIQMLGKTLSFFFSSSLITLIYSSLSKKQCDLKTDEVKTFSYHKLSNAKDIFWVVAMAQIPTLPLIHLVIELETNPAIAWIVTGLTIWSVIHYYAQVKAIKLNPLTIKNSIFHYHYGVSWSAKIPLELIKEARIVTMRDQLDPSKYFISPLGSNKNVIISFNEPVKFLGRYGIVKRKRGAVLSVDNPDSFLDALHKD